MPGKKHIVPQDVKEQILERVKLGDKPISEIAQEHCLNAKTIYNWLSKGAKAQPSWRELTKLKRENRVLHEIIGKLTVKLSLGEKKDIG